MRSKTDFYRLFFEQLARRGFDVKRSQSSDYIADIYFKNQLVAYFSKADTVIQNPFVTVKDKLIRLINDTAQDTANKAGICRDCPYTDANEKLPNGSYKLAEYNGVTLACKEHHLFGYVFSTYRTAPDSGEMMARQIFYNKEFAGQDFAKRSGLVDERALFTEEELRVLHAGLVNGFLTKLRTLSRSCGSRKWSLTLIWSSASRKKWRLEDSKNEQQEKSDHRYRPFPDV